jgi:hypothetical protein
MSSIFNKITQVSDTPFVPVGTRRTVYDPVNKKTESFIYLQLNTTSTAITKGACVYDLQDDTVTDDIANVTNASFIMGIAQGAVPAAYYAWFITDSTECSVQAPTANGVSAAGQMLTGSTTGTVTSVTSGTAAVARVFGWSKAATGASSLVTVKVKI